MGVTAAARSVGRKDERGRSVPCVGGRRDGTIRVLEPRARTLCFPAA